MTFAYAYVISCLYARACVPVDHDVDEASLVNYRYLHELWRIIESLNHTEPSRVAIRGVFDSSESAERDDAASTVLEAESRP